MHHKNPILKVGTILGLLALATAAAYALPRMDGWLGEEKAGSGLPAEAPAAVTSGLDLVSMDATLSDDGVYENKTLGFQFTLPSGSIGFSQYFCSAKTSVLCVLPFTLSDSTFVNFSVGSASELKDVATSREGISLYGYKPLEISNVPEAWVTQAEVGTGGYYFVLAILIGPTYGYQIQFANLDPSLVQTDADVFIRQIELIEP